MRICSLLLAFYILMLSVAPCTEHHHEPVPERSTVLTQLTPADHPHHNDCEHALCSPFCVCHCTGIFIHSVLQLPELTVTESYSFHPKATFWYTLSQPQGYSFAIWQPPMQS
ncbi:DUF6660 family protein [Siphonobacter sp. SORGH_AS_0500]|uniref:DUF6660 family protein n=1 Tax=Siphonobacter sp. SORGH_AS_0500 TaxID=1864824 RepID=UPI00285A31BC|nr:DUF6660 family protein [Siphonobacter sp. SORGH_AS_0500]MDR6194130.1 hypothetical protein [Siphonobacter sp. SORGH_AS_0500]